jgi:hypothetical protein
MSICIFRATGRMGVPSLQVSRLMVRLPLEHSFTVTGTDILWPWFFFFRSTHTHTHSLSLSLLCRPNVKCFPYVVLDISDFQTIYSPCNRSKAFIRATCSYMPYVENFSTCHTRIIITGSCVLTVWSYVDCNRQNKFVFIILGQRTVQGMMIEMKYLQLLVTFLT